MDDPQPVYGSYQKNKIAQAFQRDDVRDKVINYMGLIKQCDDELGRILDHLVEAGQMADAMIVLTSDQGIIWAIIGWGKRICSTNNPSKFQ